MVSISKPLHQLKTIFIGMALGAGIPNWFKLLEELPTGVADRIGGV
jgi:hypothetical protein